MLYSSGSTVRHQYPCDVPNYKPDWFAEYMLPEGAHNRLTDSTYMFLNRTESQIDEVHINILNYYCICNYTHDSGILDIPKAN